MTKQQSIACQDNHRKQMEMPILLHNEAEQIIKYKAKMLVL